MSDWKSDLESFFQDKQKETQVSEKKLTERKSEVATFFSTVVVPAFEEIKTELEKYQREVRVSSGTDFTSIVISYKGETELDYSIKVRIRPGSAFPYPEARFRDPTDGKMYKAEGFLRSGTQDYTVAQITKEEIIKDCLSGYKKAHAPSLAIVNVTNG